MKAHIHGGHNQKLESFSYISFADIMGLASVSKCSWLQKLPRWVK